MPSLLLATIKRAGYLVFLGVIGIKSNCNITLLFLLNLVPLKVKNQSQLTFPAHPFPMCILFVCLSLCALLSLSLFFFCLLALLFFCLLICPTSSLQCLCSHFPLSWNTGILLLYPLLFLLLLRLGSFTSFKSFLFASLCFVPPSSMRTEAHWFFSDWKSS